MREDATGEGASVVPFPAGGRAPERRGSSAVARQAPDAAQAGGVTQRLLGQRALAGERHTDRKRLKQQNARAVRVVLETPRSDSCSNSA